jgi:hypothetical protein
VTYLCIVLAAWAAAATALWWSERDRRMATERSGQYRATAKHAPAKTAEKDAKEALRKAEVRKVADVLAAEAAADGQRFTREELEAEARRMIAGRT